MGRGVSIQLVQESHGRKRGEALQVEIGIQTAFRSSSVSWAVLGRLFGVPDEEPGSGVVALRFKLRLGGRGRLIVGSPSSYGPGEGVVEEEEEEEVEEALADASARSRSLSFRHCGRSLSCTVMYSWTCSSVHPFSMVQMRVFGEISPTKYMPLSSAERRWMMISGSSMSPLGSRFWSILMGFTSRLDERKSLMNVAG
jgi:hypothetical protein